MAVRFAVKVFGETLVLTQHTLCQVAVSRTITFAYFEFPLVSRSASSLIPLYSSWGRVSSLCLSGNLRSLSTKVVRWNVIASYTVRLAHGNPYSKSFCQPKHIIYVPALILCGYYLRSLKLYALFTLHNLKTARGTRVLYR
ncbi:hypothetical protein L210DRAFT_324462 [Boletus edulis BED1]|uniref:Uncharacterized protein n=1 Tax=Boletus edulis BED1 TaxID=1328754 RepID=A0AAD4C091_BOLED|nr:hypothetical protein L210DRAFT_324462 [Boletus edulis BED1]